MQRVSRDQISFDAVRVESSREPPHTVEVSVSGTFELAGILDAEGNVPVIDHGERLVVTVADGDGNVLARGEGKTQVGFADKMVDEIEMTVRKQKVKLV